MPPTTAQATATPPATPPAAPPAASPAPATPPAAPPPATPPPTDPATPPPGGDPNPFADIDAAFARVEPQTPPAGTPPAGTPPPAKPSGGTPPAKPAAQKPPGTQTPPAQLRDELNRVKGELQQRTEAYVELESKIKDFEERGKNADALKSRLEEMEKELNTTRGELRALKQEASPEFKEKYDKPFHDAADYTRTIIDGLTVTDENGDSRAASFENDFVPIFRLPPGQALARAKELFGDGAQLVINQYNELKRLDYVRGNALKAEQAQWQERQKQEEGRRAQTQEQINSAWKRVNSDLTASVEDYRDPADDKEAAELRSKFFAIMDAEPKTMREQIIRDAHVRQRAAAYGPLKLRIQRLEAKLAALSGQPSPDDVPGKGRRPGGDTPPSGATETWEDAARRELGEV